MKVMEPKEPKDFIWDKYKEILCLFGAMIIIIYCYYVVSNSKESNSVLRESQTQKNINTKIIITVENNQTTFNYTNNFTNNVSLHEPFGIDLNTNTIHKNEDNSTNSLSLQNQTNKELKIMLNDTKETHSKSLLELQTVYCRVCSPK